MSQGQDIFAHHSALGASTIRSHRHTRSLDMSTFNELVVEAGSQYQEETVLSSPASMKIVDVDTSFIKDIVAMDQLDYMALSTDTYGCRLLQQQLENTDIAQIKDVIFERSRSFWPLLTVHPFGNYLIQRLCDYLTPEQKLDLIKAIYTSVYQISLNQYGTRALQKIIDSMDNILQVEYIVLAFSPVVTSIEQVIRLINDPNGNHVIQKCLYKLSPKDFDFVVEAIITDTNILKVATQKHGCCVLQKLLETCSLSQVHKITNKIIQFLPNMINDKFGNYIVQIILEIKQVHFYFISQFFHKIFDEFVELSCLKFSSNVIERFIETLFELIFNCNDLSAVASSILNDVIDLFTLNVDLLIKDFFGNYPLQRLLDITNYCSEKGNIFQVTDNPAFQAKMAILVQRTYIALSTIKSTNYCKKIKANLRELVKLNLELLASPTA